MTTLRTNVAFAIRTDICVCVCVVFVLTSTQRSVGVGHSLILVSPGSLLLLRCASFSSALCTTWADYQYFPFAEFLTRSLLIIEHRESLGRSTLFLKVVDRFKEDRNNFSPVSANQSN